MGTDRWVAFMAVPLGSGAARLDRSRGGCGDRVRLSHSILHQPTGSSHRGVHFVVIQRTVGSFAANLSELPAGSPTRCKMDPLGVKGGGT